MADLSALKIGDRLAIDDRFSRAPSIFTVSKITATQVVAGDARFAKTTGRKVGSVNAWRTIWARPATEADAITAKVDATQQRLSKFIVTADNVGAVEALLGKVA